MIDLLSVSQSKRARFLLRAKIPTLVLFLAAVVLVTRVPFTRGSLSIDAMDDSKVQRRYETSEGSPKISDSVDGLSGVETRSSETRGRTDETVLHDVSRISDVQPSVQVDTLTQDLTPDQNESQRLSPGRLPESLEREDAEKADSEHLVGAIDGGEANESGRPTGARKPSITHKFLGIIRRAVVNRPPRTDSEDDQMHAETEDATAPVPIIRRGAQLSDTAQPQGLIIHNPTSSPFSVGFLADGKTYRLDPGQHVKLAGKNSWLVVFHRGGKFGNSRKTLSAGNYSFAVTAKGWTLNAVSADPKLP
jgi:hypothetical protein